MIHMITARKLSLQNDKLMSQAAVPMNPLVQLWENWLFLLKLLGICYLVVDIVLETASVENNAMKISVRFKWNEKY